MFNTYFLVYEIVQIRIKGIINYLSELINVFDAGRILLTYLSIAFFFTGVDYSPVSTMQVLLMFAKMLTFLEIFDATRYLLQIIY